jgi:tetratricopeptide (TPR) repeat protein
LADIQAVLPRQPWNRSSKGVGIIDSLIDDTNAQRSLFEHVKSFVPHIVSFFPEWKTATNFPSGVLALIKMASALSGLITSSEEVHQRLQRASRGTDLNKQFPYFRFNVGRDIGDIGLGDWRKEEEIAVHTAAYLEEQEIEEMKSLCVKCLISSSNIAEGNGSNSWSLRISLMSIDFDRAVEIEPLTQSLKEVFLGEQEVQRYQAAIKKDPMNYWLWHNCCKIHVSMNDLEGAIYACERGIKEFTSPSPSMVLSNLYALKGNYDAAIKTYGQFYTVIPTILWLALESNDPLMKLGSYEQSSLER